MAVQKSKTTRSKKGMRRSHKKLITYPTSIDSISGEVHILHHMTSSGFYKGKKVLIKKNNLIKKTDNDKK